MMQKNNLISVIVTAYNRKKFLPYALKSLESQTLPKDKFEVIVVKNFEDQISDDIIRKNGWKDMVTNVMPLGGKIAIGLEEFEQTRKLLSLGSIDFKNYLIMVTDVTVALMPDKIKHTYWSFRWLIGKHVNKRVK